MPDLLFSPAERRGIIVFLALSVLLYLSVDAYLSHLQSRNKLSEQERQAFIALINEHEQKEENTDLTQHYGGSIDPNQASQAELVASGLKKNIAERLLNFRGKGAYFKNRSDLAKVYGMDEKWLYSEQMEFTFPSSNSFDSKEKFAADQLKALQLSAFDPNLISEEDLLAMHLPASAIKGLISFREKYRPFQKPTDIYDVYTIDSALAESIIPFVEIKNVDREITSADTLLGPISINQADTNLLKSVKGIGSYLAKSIVDYRTRLGGYYSVEQLQDLFAVDSSRFANIKNQFYCDTSFQKLNINRAEEETLYNHPYISYKLARNIVEFRERMRLFEKEAELMNIELVDGVLFSKLAPYLEIK